MLDTRAETRRVVGFFRRRPAGSAVKGLASLAVALLVAFLPAWPGLEPAARHTLFILLFGAGLWITEAIPAFAVGLLVIGIEIALLGRPGGVFATGPDDWEMFVAPFASPIIWLFFAGFVLARAATKTQVDRWIASHVLGRFGRRPSSILLATMAVTFVFSMFLSNTAATATMLAVLAPLVATRPADEPWARGLLLAVPFAANVGGMATILGSPPNAIASGALAGRDPVTFLGWMAIGLPLALVIAGLLWLYLVWRYPCRIGRVDLAALAPGSADRPAAPLVQRVFVVAVFTVTVLLWMTGPLHGLTTPVVSFLPIVALTTGGVLRSREIRELPWEVLLLMAGGLSLGVAVTRTGLADWIIAELPLGTLGALGATLVLAYLTCAMSNFMSNTAAANILVPIGLALAGGSATLVVPIALAASTSMCLPVSTPPNALAFASGRLRTRDFLLGGLFVGAIGPGLAALWTFFLDL